MPATTKTIALCKRIEQDAHFASKVHHNPAMAFRRAGVHLTDSDIPGFNHFFSSHLYPQLAVNEHTGHPLNHTNTPFKCIGCQAACYTIAATIVVLGAVGVAVLTEEAGVVVALAAFAEVSAAAALVFIKGLVALVVFTIVAITTHICGWTHACP